MAPKLGLIAGAGGLPVELARACDAAGRSIFVIRLKGMADPALNAWPGQDIEIAKLGAVLSALKKAGCKAVSFAGKVHRPDFHALKPDLEGMKALPGLLAASRKGDDALLRALLSVFERAGFTIEGADAAAGRIVLSEGAQGAHAPGDLHQADILLAVTASRRLGELDIGQAAVACKGVVLAVEAQEGTAAVLERVAGLPSELRGSAQARRGVLVKLPKPGQDLRVDLPTIGVETIEAVATAGLAGVVGVAGGMLIVDRDKVVALADRLGLFVYGLLPGSVPGR